MSQVPSWCVAVLGTLLIVVASVVSWTTLRQVNDEIAEARADVASGLRKVDSLWISHRQADQRSSTATNFITQTTGSPNAGFLLAEAAAQLRGAVLSMWAASGEEVPERPPDNVVSLENRLRNGDLTAYGELKLELERLRTLSARHISETSEAVDSKRAEIEMLESQEATAFRTYFLLSLLGLIVAMCKDLPVWNDARVLRRPRSARSPNP